MHRRPLTALVGLTALALAVTGCTASSAPVSVDTEPVAAAPQVVPSEVTETTETTETAAPTATPSVEVSDTASPTPAAPR